MRKLLLLSLFVSSLGYAATGVPDYQHEIILRGMDGSIGFGGGRTDIFLGDRGVVNVGAGYQLTLLPGVQWGIFPAFAHNSSLDADTLVAMTGPTINFPLSGDIGDAFFLNGKAGVAYSKVGATSSTDFIFGFEAGKRFRLADYVSYRPSFSLQKVSGTDVRFTINVLSFALLF